MLIVRKSGDRGFADHGWLKTHHTFSFAEYFDPRFRGYRSLRVINEDVVAPTKGFGTHPHHDMEILTYLMAGALEHKDSMGNGSVIRPGEVQYMSAGTGVQHSEFNPSADEAVHLLQIWILPNVQGAAPRYGQKKWAPAEFAHRFCLVASPDGAEGSLAIRQDARLYVAHLEPGQSASHSFKPGRRGWIHVASGAVEAGGVALSAGDGGSIAEEKDFPVRATAKSQVLLFDLD